MKIKFVSFILWFVLINGFISAQSTYFSNVFSPFKHYQYGTSIIETDSFYFVGGIAVDSFPYYRPLVIFKLDKSGNLLSIKYPGRDSVSYDCGYASLNKVSDDGYIWVGGLKDGNQNKSFLMKFDSLLNLEWQSEYDTLGRMQVKQTYDNGYITVGGIGIPMQMGNDILLVKTDSLGNREWQKSFDRADKDRGCSIIQAVDRGYLIGAYYYGNQLPVGGLIIKTDSLGNEEWRKDISSIYGDIGCIVKNSNDSNFIVGTATATGLHQSSYSLRKIRLLKISETGSVIWDKYYGPIRLGNTISQVIIQDDNNIVMTGCYFPDSVYYSPGDSLAPKDIRSWILKTNSNGDSLWMKEYYKQKGPDFENYIYDIKQTQDYGYIATGIFDTIYVGRISMWVLKLDSLGCDTPGCNNVFISEVPLNKNQIKIYPNPAKGIITIDINNNNLQNAFINIYNSEGRQIKNFEFLSQKLPASVYKLDVSNMPPGIYFGRIVFENGEIYGFKFIVN